MCTYTCEIKKPCSNWIPNSKCGKLKTQIWFHYMSFLPNLIRFISIICRLSFSSKWCVWECRASIDWQIIYSNLSCTHPTVMDRHMGHVMPIQPWLTWRKPGKTSCAWKSMPWGNGRSSQKETTHFWFFGTTKWCLCIFFQPYLLVKYKNIDRKNTKHMYHTECINISRIYILDYSTLDAYEIYRSRPYIS